jgi:two-component system, cell cycle sensor histidine kinase and response regulator CckA
MLTAPDGHILWANASMCRLLGRTEADIIRIGRGRIMDTSDPRLAPALDERNQMGSVQNIELTCVRKDGLKIPVELSSAIFQDKEGNTRTSIILRDITERKQAETALRQSEEKYRTLVDTAPFGIQLTDLEGRIVYSNPAHHKMQGYGPHELTGMHIWDLMAHDSHRVKAREYYQTIISNKPAPTVYCSRDRTRDGREIDTQISWDYIHNEKNEVTGIISIVEDITERKQAEEALRRSNRLLKGTFSSLMDAIFILDSKPVVTDCNSAAATIFGYSREEILGRTVDCLHVDQGSLENFRQHLAAQMAEKGMLHLSEFTMKHKDGTIFPTEHSVMPLEDDHGEKIGWVSVVRDITDRKRAEEEHKKLQVQLHQAQKMESVGRLAGGVAHDFNNMLGVILGHIEMALEDVDPAVPLHNSLQAVQYAAKRSAALTRQLLAFARKQAVAPKVINLNETVAGMLNMLRQLIGEDIDLLWCPGEDLPQVKVDPAQIDQLLANLCVNARDAIEGVGKITIETASAAFDEAYCAAHHGFVPGEYILLAVSDDGCGMDKKTLNQIFEPFFTTKEQGKGTGLGLASIYGIVKQNNGFINVYSEPGLGTTFKIYLPAYAIKSDGVVEKAPDLPAEHGNETILLVEDESAILEMTTRILERLGYTVVAAATPGEAIRLAHEYRGRIDLLMTDVVMPEMNGRQLTGNLLSHYPDLKRLFMSGYTADVIAHHGVLEEGVHFIQKPFSMKDLGGKLREVLEG